MAPEQQALAYIDQLVAPMKDGETIDPSLPLKTKKEIKENAAVFSPSPRVYPPPLFFSLRNNDRERAIERVNKMVSAR